MVTTLEWSTMQLVHIFITSKKKNFINILILVIDFSITKYLVTALRMLSLRSTILKKQFPEVCWQGSTFLLVICNVAPSRYGIHSITIHKMLWLISTPNKISFCGYICFFAFSYGYFAWNTEKISLTQKLRNNKWMVD